SGTASGGSAGKSNGAGGSGGKGGGTGGSSMGGKGGGNPGGAGQGGSGTAGTSSAGTSGQAGMGGGAGSSATPGVRIVGRTEKGTDGPRFSWPGVSFEARFSGTQASIQLSDAANANEFEVVVDGTVASKPLVTASGQTSYPVATGLADGNHDVLVWRRTEAYYNPTEFLGFTGFSASGALLAPPDPKPHRIEVIGDSITVGYGNEGTLPCTADTTNENNYLAYASVAAREVSADLVTIAWSGIGMYRNYGDTGPSTDTMPTRYDRAVPTEDDSTWDFSQYTPEAVVINLGTNDYSTHGDPGQPFIDAYVNFVEHLRTKYANAYIFCLIPESDAAANIDAVVSMMQSSGDKAIESFDITVTEGGADGCDYHPDLVRDQAMGDKLAGELKNVLGW
ncbi:MAG TPA: SGNH/GDSL hydrolase family protein, partial [Polyangiaceae bacterium]|nr:SGNH/GDSL hydrolase family protein [Polyangiaceae bacterium]